MKLNIETNTLESELREGTSRRLAPGGKSWDSFLEIFGRDNVIQLK